MKIGKMPAIFGLLTLFSAAPLAAQDGKTPEARPRPRHALLAQLQDEFCEIAAEVGPSVVTVACEKTEAKASPGELASGRGASHGSGVIIRSEGWILTNNHVVAEADRITIRLRDGREFRGVAYRDPRSDLALIKIETSKPLPAARLGDSDQVKIGQWAITIGSPYKYDGTFAFGIISGLGRRLTISDAQRDIERVYPNMIQTDAPINSGNSGGPLCNSEGEVVGISTATQVQDAGSVGIGFAIPINTAKFVIKSLMAGGQVHYGYLGLSLTDLTPPLAAGASVPDGALIEEDPPTDSPASKAGLRAGDIVTEWEADAIHSEAALRQRIAETRPGTVAHLKIVRRTQEMTVTATVGESRDAAAPEKARLRPPKLRIGLGVETLTARAARRRLANASGVVITSVDPNSAAADRDDLANGVLILQVNDTETPTEKAYLDAIKALKPGSLVRLLCLLDRGRKVIVLPVD